MSAATRLRCDGCGQPASAEHIARRLKRLEWTTRCRPVHITRLFMGAFSPLNDDEFLYAQGSALVGEAERMLTAAGLRRAGNSPEALQAEFQRRGFLLAHILECPLDVSTKEPTALFEERLAFVCTRIRRSLKPKSVVLISRLLEPLVESFARAQLGCPMVLDRGKPFGLDDDESGAAVARLSQVLASSPTVR